jgi:23S rRNA (adenine2503-C2)-methyltransferase
MRLLEREKTFGTFDTPEGPVSEGFVEKLLLELEDRNAVEAVVIATFGPRVRRALELDAKIGELIGVHPAARLGSVQDRIRYEACISTQVGCALDCQFCASSLVPFVRNLSVEEMEGELAAVEEQIPREGDLRKVVFAGIGEPLMNYDNVSAVVRALDRRGVVAKINTVGVIPSLERLIDEDLPSELAVSIHAPDDDLRSTLMPAGKGYTIAEICRVLARAPARMKIEAKYLMLRDLNDSQAHADRLAERLAGLRLTIGIQIYNHIAERSYLPSPPERVREFVARLRSHGLSVGVLNSNIGEPVRGGCGQLRAQIVQLRRTSGS